MIDRERVIQALERCIDGCSNECPYEYGGAVTLEYCRADLMRDALELLKEQEPVKPKKWVPKGQVFARVMGWYCPKCDAGLSRGDKYCHNCGQAVKWDE